MTNWRPERVDMYEDVQTLNYYPERSEADRLRLYHRASRDSARTPMQWSAEDNAGFTSGTPWFFINGNYKEINVSSQENDPDSLLNFYRKAISLHKSLVSVKEGKYKEHFHLNRSFYCYSMECSAEKLLVICSFCDKKKRFMAPKGFSLENGELLLSNGGKGLSNGGFTAEPYEARVYRFT